MALAGRIRVLAVAILVWVVTVAGVIGGVVPPAEAQASAPSAGLSPIPAFSAAVGLPVVTAGFAESAQADGRVPALLLARAGGRASATPAEAGVGVPAPLGLA